MLLIAPRPVDGVDVNRQQPFLSASLTGWGCRADDDRAVT